MLGNPPRPMGTQPTMGIHNGKGGPTSGGDERIRSVRMVIAVFKNFYPHQMTDPYYRQSQRTLRRLAHQVANQGLLAIGIAGKGRHQIIAHDNLKLARIIKGVFFTRLKITSMGFRKRKKKWRRTSCK